MREKKQSKYWGKEVSQSHPLRERDRHFSFFFCQVVIHTHVDLHEIDLTDMSTKH